MSTAKLQVLSEGAMRGISFPLTGESYTLGRKEGCDICIPDTTISGHHCTLFQVSDGVYGVRDEGSTNGTRVNGETLEAQGEVQLKQGDILQCGGIELLFDSGEAARVVRHKTGVISLEDNIGESQTVVMKNMNARGGRKTPQLREKRGQRTALYVVIGILVLGVIAALGYAAMNIFSGN